MTYSADRLGQAPAPAVPMWLLGSITLSGTLGIHIFAPALVLAGLDLRSTPAEMQLSIGMYVWGLAFGQLVHGPLADRYGRRPVLLGGLALFTLAGMAAAVSARADTLYICRLFQALGGCSGMVIARAIVRDLGARADIAGSLAKLNLMVIVGPGIGPVLGGLIAAQIGWRAILALLAILGAGNFLAVTFLLPETGRAQAVARQTVFRNYLGLVKSLKFAAYACSGGCVTTAWYGFLSAAPFIYQRYFRITPEATGLHMGTVVAGAWIGSFAASRLSKTLDAASMLKIGHRLSFIMALILFALFWLDLDSPVRVTFIMVIFTCGVGFAGPAALALATSVNPFAAGSASGLYGFVQMAIGAIAVALASLGADHRLVPAAILIAAGVVAQGLLLTVSETASPPA